MTERKLAVTFSSMKGGVGKSSNAILLANNLAARGRRVLLVDMDTNNSCTLYYTMGIADNFEAQNIFKALSDRNAAANVVRTRIPNVDIIPSSLRLFDIRTIDYHVLKKILPAEGYDYVIIDTAPTYDNIVQNALYAADLILTPIQLDSFNLTTSLFLRSHLIDEMGEQFPNWYLFYSHWQETLAPFANSMQSQFADEFRKRFANILQAQIPQTPAVGKYTQAGEKVSVKSRMVGAKRLAVAVNKLADMITGEENPVEEF